MINVLKFSIENYTSNSEIAKNNNRIIINNLFFEFNEDISAYENKKTNIKIREISDDDELQVYFNFFDLQRPIYQTFLETYAETLSELLKLIEKFSSDYKKQTPYALIMYNRIYVEICDIEKIKILFQHWFNISGVSYLHIISNQYEYLETKEDYVRLSDFYFKGEHIINVSNRCIIKTSNKAIANSLILSIATDNKGTAESVYVINHRHKCPVSVNYDNVKLLKVEKNNNDYKIFLVPQNGCQFTITTKLKAHKYDFSTGNIINSTDETK